MGDREMGKMKVCGEEVEEKAKLKGSYTVEKDGTGHLTAVSNRQI